MPANCAATWDSTDVQTLKELHANGMSASQIAAAIGKTRNSVLGKIFRMGLSKPFVPWPEGVPRPKRKRNRTTSVRRWRERLLIPATPKLNGGTTVKTDICSILQLTDRRCHWPMWDGEERGGFYCGARIDSGDVYCGCHWEMARRDGVKRPLTLRN